MDWNSTIRKNLKNYQPDYKTIIPEIKIGYGKKQRSTKDIILCIDQSGSMGTSVVYSSIFGAVLASIPSVSTKMVVFDTSVADLTEDLQDPIDLLFGAQLGGGTDINKALGYCETLITKPNDTTFVLITDLEEGGNQASMRQRLKELHQSGVTVVVLLALNDEGEPFYDKANAAYCASLGIPVFACTPNLFPDLMAKALEKQDLTEWASQNNIATKRKK